MLLRPRARRVVVSPGSPVSPVRLLSLTLATILAVGLTATGATAAVPAPIPVPVPVVGPIPTPAASAVLPAGIEGLARFVPAVSCDSRARTGTTRLGTLLVATYPGTRFGAERSCGSDPLATSEHYDGRALDWMVSSRDATGAARAEAVLSWLFATDTAGNPFANARRLGIMYVIWNNNVWGAYRSGDGWRPYSTCATKPGATSDTTCHRDHVHFSLSWEGATGRTSFWSGSVAATDFGPCRDVDLNWATPYTQANPLGCPTFPRIVAPPGATALTKSLTTFSGMSLATGSTGPAVSAVQRALQLAADGVFGSATRAALIAFQQAHQLPGTGRVDAGTWRALLRATTTVPLNETTPGVVRPVWPPVVSDKPGTDKPVTTKPVTTKPVTTKPTKPVTPKKVAVKHKPATRKAGPLTRYRATVLRRGAHGAAVKALQRALGVRPRNGSFGAKTRAAVIRFQRSHRLPATGVVALRTWRALGA